MNRNEKTFLAFLSFLLSVNFTVIVTLEAFAHDTILDVSYDNCEADTECKGRVFMGTLNSIIGNLPNIDNGSYILPNGITVLVDADLEAYFDGTLEFYLGEKE